MQCDLLNSDIITISNDTVAIRDQIDERGSKNKIRIKFIMLKCWKIISRLFSVIHLLEIGSNISYPAITHKTGIIVISLSQAGTINNRFLALIDKNRDLYLMMINSKVGATTNRKLEKLGKKLI